MLAMLPLAMDAVSAPPPASGPVLHDASQILPKAYTVGGALDIADDASFQFSSSSGPVRLDVSSIVNESPTTTSGSVRAGLFVSADLTLTTYYVIARIDLGTLQPGFFFGPLSNTVSYLAPPDGIYYIHMGAFEFEPGTCGSPDSYCLDDWVTFTNRVQVVGGMIFDAGPPPPPTTTAVEYYHAGFDHYFVTTIENEIALLDAGRFPGWVRTNATFPVWPTNPGGLHGMCRYYSAAFAPKSSHFYSPLAFECQVVQASPLWQFETVAFFVELPDGNGNCLPGTQQLFRLFNEGLSGAPNHRYTISLNVRTQMVAQGWTSEGFGPLGTIACVPI
jgi:hypothetical protein